MTPATADGQVREAIARRSGDIRKLLAEGRRSRLVATGAAVFCLLAGVYLAIHRQDASHLHAASELSARGNQAAALREAGRVSRRPAETHALLLRAYALRAEGRPAEALGAFARAAARDPKNWKIRRDWAVSLQAAAQRREAGREMGVALSLNPRLDLPPGFTRRSGRRPAA